MILPPLRHKQGFVFRIIKLHKIFATNNGEYQSLGRPGSYVGTAGAPHREVFVLAAATTGSIPLCNPLQHVIPSLLPISCPLYNRPIKNKGTETKKYLWKKGNTKFKYIFMSWHLVSTYSLLWCNHLVVSGTGWLRHNDLFQTLYVLHAWHSAWCLKKNPKSGN